jgi:hypothetical protein
MAHNDLDALSVSAHMPLSTNSGPGRLEKKHLMRIALLLIIHHSMHGLPATRLSEHAATPVPLGHVRIRRVQILLLQPSPNQARHRKLGTRGCSSRAVPLHILQARLCNAVAHSNQHRWPQHQVDAGKTNTICTAIKDHWQGDPAQKPKASLSLTLAPG